MSLSSWSVACAILVRYKRPMHYTELAEKVLESGLTSLKSNGGKTPEQTMRASMSCHKMMAESIGNGVYQLYPGAEKDSEVRLAMEALERVMFQRRYYREQNRNKVLRQRLDAIKKKTLELSTEIFGKK